jgi:hypothetical protein
MRWALLFAMLLWGCSKGPDADLPSIAAARSLGAEWALVNEQDAKGHLTSIYTSTMREQLREQLRSTLNSLQKPNSNYGREIGALLRLKDDAAPELLRVHVANLKRAEDQLESA